jgi:glycosidase
MHAIAHDMEPDDPMRSAKPPAAGRLGVPSAGGRLPEKVRGLARSMAAARAVMMAVLGAAMILGPAPAASAAPPAGDEIFYLIFVRSFRDSNGDGKGDLKGIEQELGYLQGLGVTTVVLTPLYQSPFYHSYFATDFSRIDPAYGTEADFRSLVQALHRRGMRIFIDQEVQYVAADHEWFRDSLGNPDSRYGRYILYNGPGNTQPESAELPSYDGKKILVATVNMHEPAVLEYQTRLFEHWMNPTGAGADDGVDGFRIDHMMDDLDQSGKLTGLFARFWSPMFRRLRDENPRIRILAEQADWGSYGDDWFSRGNVDMVYAFRIRWAIAALDKKQLVEAVNETWRRTPAGRQQLVFVENHDTNRFATEVGGDARRERLGACLNLLLRGIPLIYYGQELGVEGRQGHWMSDGNDIPVRQAFPWTVGAGPGIAAWYRDTGPWWAQSALALGSSISLDREAGRPGSLLSYYKALIALRRTHPELVSGDQAIAENDSASVFSFVRSDGAHQILVAANLAGSPVTAHVRIGGAAPAPRSASLHDVFTGGLVARGADGGFAVTLQGYGVSIDEVSAGN